MNTLIDLNELLKYDNNRYLGQDFSVNLNGKNYSFIKNNLDIYPKKIGHPLYSVKNKQCAAYLLREVWTGQIYVGSSEEVYDRVSKHKFYIAKRRHENSKFEALLRTSTMKDFELIVIFAKDREEAYTLEQYFVNRYQNSGLLLNIANDVRYAMLGKPQTDEHKRKIREALLGRVLTEESKQLLSEYRKNSLEAQNQIRLAGELVKKKILLNGVIYESIVDASRKTGLGESTIRRGIAKNKKESNDGTYILDYTKPARKRVSIDGVVYENAEQASKRTGLSRSIIKGHLKSGKAFYV